MQGEQQPSSHGLFPGSCENVRLSPQTCKTCQRVDIKWRNCVCNRLSCLPARLAAGVLVQGSDEVSLALQDGTGVLPLQMVQESLKTGIYVLVVGAYLLGADGSPFLLVHKIVDLSSNPDRDTFWRLEVAEIHKLFYDKLMNASST